MRWRAVVLFAALGLLTLCVPRPLAAHRLDELLQAARIGIDRARVDLELDLTPGASIARGVFDGIDRNRDGALSDEEEDAYARDVLGSLAVDVDGRPQLLELTGRRFPPLFELSAGTGVIQLTARARFPPTLGWRHHVRFRNAHRPDISVYLANALASSNPAIAIGRQIRDTQQREITIEYETGSAGRWVRFAAGAAGLAALVAWRLTRRT